jgi:hypothetical protein
MRGHVGRIALLGIMLATSRAHAEASAHDKAMASQLFDDAERLFNSGKVVEACPKYGESFRLDPQLGTLLHLGECYAKAGKTAAAWVSFKDAVELAVQKSDPREKKIRDRLRQLESSMPKLVITVPPNAPSDLEIRQDGEIVGHVVWGSPVPVDPGVHTISAKAYGRKPWIGNVQIAATATTFEVKIPELAPEATSAQAGPVPAPAPVPQAVQAVPTGPATTQLSPQAQPQAAGPAQPPQPESQPGAVAPPPAADTHHASTGTTQKILGWTSIGLGAVGIGLGTVFAIQRSTKLNERDQICPEQVRCFPEDLEQNDALTNDARSASTISTVGFIAGGVFAATGIVLLVTAPKAPKAEGVSIVPAVGPGFQGLAVHGRL